MQSIDIRRCANFTARRRISWIDQRMSVAAMPASFSRLDGVGLGPDGRHDSIGKHDERDVPVPTVPGAAFVMIKAKRVFGGLEAFLNAPTLAFNLDQRVDGCAGRTPCGEICKFTISKAASDHNAPYPKAGDRRVLFSGIKIGKRAIGPVKNPFAFRAMTSR